MFHRHFRHRAEHRHGPTPHGRGPNEHRGGGARRPLRFLSHKLALDDGQTREVAELLADLKTERAAADVELERAKKRYADSVKGESFDAVAAKQAGEQVVQAHAARQNAVHEALGRLHGLLDDEQRRILSVIVRTGPLVL